ncbi:centrosomal protein of 112 kDa isoform X1 [Tachysurus ichikawai]
MTVQFDGVQANSRLKQLEKEYTQKLAKSAQTMAELQTTLFSIKDESKQTQLALERQIEEARTHWEEERRQLSRDADRVSKALQERVESLQRQLRTAEKKLMSRELETQEQRTAEHLLNKNLAHTSQQLQRIGIFLAPWSTKNSFYLREH